MFVCPIHSYAHTYFICLLGVQHPLGVHYAYLVPFCSSLCLISTMAMTTTPVHVHSTDMVAIKILLLEFNSFIQLFLSISLFIHWTLSLYLLETYLYMIL